MTFKNHVEEVSFWNLLNDVVYFGFLLRKRRYTCERRSHIGADLCTDGWVKMWETHAAGWLVICEHRAQTEISHQTESFSSRLQDTIKVRVAISADAVYSLALAPNCRMRGLPLPSGPAQPMSIPRLFILHTHSHSSVIAAALPCHRTTGLCI